MDHADWKARSEAARTLLTRLEVGDELHQEAARTIRQLKGDLAEEIQGAREAVRESYAEGRWAEREEREA